MAFHLQNRSSELFGVDINPAARIGYGLFLDHATGFVMGETSVVGNNCSIMQAVTLGGTGKSNEDRHPKIKDHVLIGAGAVVLENTICESGWIYAGVPAKKVKKLNKEQSSDSIERIANSYMMYASWFK